MFVLKQIGQVIIIVIVQSGKLDLLLGLQELVENLLGLYIETPLLKCGLQGLQLFI